MGVFSEPRFDDRLAAAERVAAPHLQALGLGDAREVASTSFARPPEPPDPAAIGALEAVPADVLADLRLVLLRRIAESDLGTPGSLHGLLRSRLSGLAPAAPDDLALELALCRFAMDLGFGVSLGWLRLALLDPTLADLERLGVEDVSPELLVEVERSVDLLANETMVMDAGSTDRRFRLLLVLQRVGGGSLPASAFDPGDPFGEAMRTIAATDDGVGRGLGPLLPIAAKATAAVPDRRQRAALEDLVADGSDAGPLRDAVLRLLQRLAVAPLSPRGPGLVTVRPSNQRLGRAALWALPGLLPRQAATLLGDVGVRLGTSGKGDNQARDAAMAGTCAALLGRMDADDAVASLARMLARVRNKPVRKQVAKALVAVAERAGLGVDELVERSLPTFGLDADGSRSLVLGAWTADVRLADDGRVVVGWSGPDRESRLQPPSELREGMPGEVAEVSHLVDGLRAALADERRRLERLLAEEREWPVDAWRRRFIEHPVAGVHGRRLIWRLIEPGRARDGLPDGAGLIDGGGRPFAWPSADTRVRLWHPVEASAAEVDAWRDRLFERRVVQPFKQAFRETYSLTGDADAVLERRFADRPLAYGQMRALMGSRGWTAPMLGPFDQGDHAVAYLEVAGGGFRAELEHVPAGMGDPRERVEYARSGSVRFSAASGGERSAVLLRDVPPRLVSEALRDIDLFTSVPDPMRSPTSSAEADASPLLRTRADAARRIVSRLPHGRSLSVLGLWLRVERAGRAWAIFLANGTTLRLPDEEEVEVAIDDEAGDVGYLPFEDEILLRVLRTAQALLASEVA